MRKTVHTDSSNQVSAVGGPIGLLELWPATHSARVAAGAALIAFVMVLLPAMHPFVGAAHAAAGLQEPAPTPTPSAPMPPPPVPTPAPMPHPGMPYPAEPPMPPEMCTGTVLVIGQVVDPSGSPATNAMVLGEGASAYEFCPSNGTNEAGQFVIEGLSAGESTLYAQPSWEDAHMLFPSDEVIINAAAGETIALDEPLVLKWPQVVGTFQLADGSLAEFASGLIAPAVDSACSSLDDLYENPYGGPAPYPMPHPEAGGGTEWHYINADEQGQWGATGLVSQQYCLYMEQYWYGPEGDSLTIPPEPLLFDFDESAYGGTLAPLDLGAMQFLAPSKRIDGSVVDQNGQPVANIGVDASSADGMNWVSTVSDQNGLFEFNVGGGLWHITAHSQHGPYSPPNAGSETTVTFADDDSEEVQAVQLAISLPESVIKGQIVGPNGEPISTDMGYEVSVYISAAMDEPMEPHYGYFDAWAEVDENGAFSARVFGGLYSVNIEVFSYENPYGHTELFGPTLENIEVADKEEVSLGTIALSGPQMQARVVRPDGTGVPYLSFTISEPVDGQCLELSGEIAPVPIVGPDFGYGHSLFHGATNEEGILAAGGLPAGDLCLNLSQPWDEAGLIPSGPTLFTLTEGGELLDLGDIALIVPPKQINGRVQDESGQGVAGAMISAYQMEGSGWAHTETAPDGSFDLSVAGGPWTVDAEAPYDWGGNGYWNNDASQVVVFATDNEPETTTISFTLQAPNATIQGRLLDVNGQPLPPYSGWVEIYSLHGYGTSAELMGDGRFSLRVVQGIYEMIINIYDEVLLADGYMPQLDLVEIEANQVLDLGDIQLLPKTAVISGLVLGNGKEPIANASVTSWSYDDPWGFGDWSYATTNASGAYSMTVRGGSMYDVGVEQNHPATYFVLDPPKQVMAVDNETVTVNHTVYPPAATVEVRVVDGEGNLLTDVYATAYARRTGMDYPEEPPMPEEGVQAQSLDGGIYGGMPPYGPYDEIANERVVNGIAALNLPVGDFLLGLYLDYGNNDYTFMEEISSTVEAGGGEEVTSAGLIVQRGRMVDLLNAGSRDAGSHEVEAAGGQAIEIRLAGEERISISAPATAQSAFYGLPGSTVALRQGQATGNGPTGDEAPVPPAPDPEPLPLLVVEIPLAANDAVITGSLRDLDNEVVTGVYGEVNLWAGAYGDAWSYAPIDPNTGTYETVVAEGLWHMSYYVHEGDYVASSYDDVQIQAVSEQTTTHDIELQPLSAKVVGSLLDPDGQPVAYGYVWANSVEEAGNEEAGDEEAGGEEPALFGIGSGYGHYTGAEVINGAFELKLVPGLTYQIGAEVMYGHESDYAPVATVVAQADETTTVTLQFQRPDATLTVTVYRVGQTEDGEATREVAPRAYVYGWTESGHHSFAEANDDGVAVLHAFSGTQVHIGGDWYPGYGYEHYHSAEEVVVDVAQPGDIATELNLTLYGEPLPEALTENVDVAQTWTASMSDGTRISIPAGAIPVANQAGADATVTIAPSVANMPDTATARRMGYGYDLEIADRSSGTAISRDLNLDATLTLFYTDAELDALGITEAQLAPAYFSEAEGVWKRADNFTVDTDNNQVTVQVRQGSNWALVVPTAVTADGPTGTLQEPAVFLPFMP